MSSDSDRQSKALRKSVGDGDGACASGKAPKRQRFSDEEQKSFPIEPICDFPALHCKGQCWCLEREILVNSPSSTEESSLLEPAAQQLEAGAGLVSESKKARKLFERACLRLDLAQIAHNRSEGRVHEKEKKLKEARERVVSAKEELDIAYDTRDQATPKLREAIVALRKVCPHDKGEELTHTVEYVTVQDHGFGSTRSYQHVFHVCKICKRRRAAVPVIANEYCAANKLAPVFH
jgi:hypothetical protein